MKYEKPVIEVIIANEEDVVRTSDPYYGGFGDWF